MRKWIVILLLLAAGVLGILWWLGQSLNAEKPESGEVRLEIENVL